MSEKQNIDYSAVDLFKMICAVLVMLIHTKPFASIFWIDAGIGMITRFAVPFFFTTAGFFLFTKINARNLNERRIITKHYIVRLLRFYSIWFIILRFEERILSGNSHDYKYYVKQFFFTTDGSPLWFVNALIWAVIIVSGLSICLSKIVVLVIGVLCLVLGYSLSTLLGITYNIDIVKTIIPLAGFLGIQGGVFFAFPYVALGASISEIDNGAQNKKTYFLMMATIWFVCLGIESLIAVIKLNAPYTFLWLSAFPMTYYVLRLLLIIKLDESDIYYRIRKISTLFYVLHYFVLLLLRKIFLVTGFYVVDSLNIMLSVLTLFFTLLLSCITLRISERNNMKWLKYIM